MQTHLNHPHGDGDTPCLDDRWYKVLAELRETLEALNPEGRCAHSLLLLRLLDWRCTNAASGYILGHVHGRAGDLLALLTVAHDDLVLCRPLETARSPSDAGLEKASRLPARISRLPCGHGTSAWTGQIGLGANACAAGRYPASLACIFGAGNIHMGPAQHEQQSLHGDLPAAILDAMVEEGEQRLEQPTSQEPVSSEQARV